VFLAGGIVAELGRKADVGGVSGGRDSVRVLGATRTP
jgi:NH3-dependent NAD+ synthetase